MKRMRANVKFNTGWHFVPDDTTKEEFEESIIEEIDEENLKITNIETLYG